MGKLRGAAAPPFNLPVRLALNRIDGLDPTLVERLCARFETLDALLGGNLERALGPGAVSPSVISRFSDREVLRRGVALDMEWLAQPHHHVLTLQDPRYPALLRQITRPPPLLHLAGDPAVLESLQVAIVGSRQPTRAGVDTARLFARSLGEIGLTITSGMAAGIDTAAHQGALAASAPTIAVLGTGIDRVYPARNRNLAKQIAEGGALISEFPLGRPPIAANFPRRNRIISGLSLGVLVVEANRRSGSLITARFALEQNRELFAIPGSIHNAQSRGCHQLIRDGAKLVESIDEILEELAPLAQFQVEAVASIKRGPNPPIEAAGLSPDQQTLLAALDIVPSSVDLLVEATGFTAEQVAAQLIELELKSLVAGENGGYVRRVHGIDGPGQMPGVRS